MTQQIHQTVKDAAIFYSVTEETIRRWLRKKKLIAKQIGRDYRFIQEPAGAQAAKK